MYYVYILKLPDRSSYYIGYSHDLKNRLKYHEQGKVATTKNTEPELVWYCAFVTKSKALAFETYLKSSSGFAFRNKRLLP